MNQETAVIPDASVENLPKRDLFGLDEPELRAWFTGHGEPAYRGTQLLKWVHQLGVTDYDAMTNMSKALRERLGRDSTFALPEMVREQIAVDGTIKWLLRVDETNGIETVFIPEPARGTLCVSSQVGCALNCSFCSTAQQGFNRNLSTAEVIGQLFLARQRLNELREQDPSIPPISNVVMMGMGEPLLNFENVVPAMSLMLNDNAYGLARRRVTLSTAGHVPNIRRLKATLPVALAVSLHAPNDALRDELVPLNKSFPIAELMAACRDFVDDGSRDKITYEYVMLDGINDSPAEARALVKLLRRMPAKINLIPFNPFPGTSYERSSNAAIETFRDILTRGGLMTMTRKTRGDDIDAACGQLAGKVAARAARVRVAREQRAARAQTQLAQGTESAHDASIASVSVPPPAPAPSGAVA